MSDVGSSESIYAYLCMSVDLEDVLIHCSLTFAFKRQQILEAHRGCHP